MISGVVSLKPALSVVSPAGAKTLALSAELVVNAETKAMNRVAIGVFGFVLGAQRGPKSGCRVPTLTASPLQSGAIVICASRLCSQT